MVSNNELRQMGRTLGIGGKKREIIFERVCDPQGYPYKWFWNRVWLYFTAGNATPDSNRFSAGGQTNNQHFIRNGGGNESPGKLIWILDNIFLLGCINRSY